MGGQMPSDPGAVLVIGPSWVGDMVMAQPLVEMLKRRPETPAVDILAPAWSAPLIHRMPGARRALEAPFRHGQLGLSARYQLGSRLRAERYRQAIVLPNSFKSALVARFARIPLRTGWRGEWRYPLLNDCRVLADSRHPLMVQRFAALALPNGEPLPDPLPAPRLVADVEGVEEALQVHQLDRDRPVLALCPGAEFGEAKQWPAEHHAALAAEKIRDGWQVWLFGSANDRPMADSIENELVPNDIRRCHNLAGRTSLAQAIDLLSVSDAVVSNDSGLMHVAAALHRPLVALFGSTSWTFTPPMTEPVSMLATDIDCRPCFQRQCPLGHRHCLVRLSPADVSRHLESVMSGKNHGAVTLPMMPLPAGA
ncbi:MAG: lipopolysaccharide heptosyltransferase II [Pseudohongiellaceae bacterium]